MANKEFVVISDIHSVPEFFEKLKYYVREYENIFILGDVTDRGPNYGEGGIDMLLDIMDYNKNVNDTEFAKKNNLGNIYYIPGNHDDFLYNFTKNNSQEAEFLLLRNYGDGTIEDVEELKEKYPDKFDELVEWLGSQPLQRIYKTKDGYTLYLAHAFFDVDIYKTKPDLSLSDAHGNKAKPYYKDRIEKILWFRIKKGDEYTHNHVPDPLNGKGIEVIGHTPHDKDNPEISFDLMTANKGKIKVCCVDGGATFKDIYNRIYKLDNSSGKPTVIDTEKFKLHPELDRQPYYELRDYVDQSVEYSNSKKSKETISQPAPSSSGYIKTEHIKLTPPSKQKEGESSIDRIETEHIRLTPSKDTKEPGYTTKKPTVDNTKPYDVDSAREIAKRREQEERRKKAQAIIDMLNRAKIHIESEQPSKQKEGEPSIDHIETKPVTLTPEETRSRIPLEKLSVDNTESYKEYLARRLAAEKAAKKSAKSDSLKGTPIGRIIEMLLNKNSQKNTKEEEIARRQALATKRKEDRSRNYRQRPKLEVPNNFYWSFSAMVMNDVYYLFNNINDYDSLEEILSFLYRRHLSSEYKKYDLTKEEYKQLIVENVITRIVKEILVDNFCNEEKTLTCIHNDVLLEKSIEFKDDNNQKVWNMLSKEGYTVEYLLDTNSLKNLIKYTREVHEHEESINNNLFSLLGLLYMLKYYREKKNADNIALAKILNMLIYNPNKIDDIYLYHVKNGDFDAFDPSIAIKHAKNAVYSICLKIYKKGFDLSNETFIAYLIKFIDNGAFENYITNEVANWTRPFCCEKISVPSNIIDKYYFPNFNEEIIHITGRKK